MKNGTSNVELSFPSTVALPSVTCGEFVSYFRAGANFSLASLSSCVLHERLATRSVAITYHATPIKVDELQLVSPGKIGKQVMIPVLLFRVQA